MNEILKAVEVIGIPMTVCAYIMWKYDKDSKEIRKEIADKEEEHKDFVNTFVSARVDELKKEVKEANKELKEVRQEAREEKLLFKQSIEMFQKSVDSFASMNENMQIMRNDINEIRSDIEEMKHK